MTDDPDRSREERARGCERYDEENDWMDPLRTITEMDKDRRGPRAGGMNDQTREVREKRGGVWYYWRRDVKGVKVNGRGETWSERWIQPRARPGTSQLTNLASSRRLNRLAR